MAVEIRRVDLENFQMKYIRFGKGPKTMVIIPGIALKAVLNSADAVKASLRFFEEDFTVYLFDPREDLPEVYTVEEAASDMTMALDALGLKQVCLYGVSHGGLLAQMIAIRRPDLVSRMILAATGSTVNDKSLGLVVGRWRELAEAGEIEALCRDFFSNVYTKEFYEKFGEFLIKMSADLSQKDLARIISQIKGMEAFSCENELSQIKCPTFVLGAAQDRLVDLESTRRFADGIGAELYIYEDYGHAFYDEAPDMQKRIRNFFCEEETEEGRI